MDKKGLLGLDTAKVVLLALMIIVVLLITAFIILENLQTTVDEVDKSSGTLNNESLASPLLTTGDDFSVIGTYRNPVCSVKLVYNTSTVISSVPANYTLSSNDCHIVNDTTGTATGQWYVSYTFTYDQPYTTSVIQNYTTGSNNFVKQIPTFFVLLAVVVLILIIAIVIVAVSRFGGQPESM